MIKIEREVKKIETTAFDTYYDLLLNRVCLGKSCKDCLLRQDELKDDCVRFMHKLADRMNEEVKRYE